MLCYVNVEKTLIVAFEFTCAVSSFKNYFIFGRKLSQLNCDNFMYNMVQRLNIEATCQL